MSRASRHKSPRLLLAALLLFLGSKAGAEEIRVLYKDGFDSVGSYCMGLLKLALKHIDHPYEIVEIPDIRTGARAIEDVRSGELDVIWGGASKELEEVLLPVRIPLYKGLFGYRIMIIRQGDQEKFNGISDLEGLKRLTLAQGFTWADTQVLEQNDLNVLKIHKYPSFFYMLEGGRYDAFPRGLQEPWRELQSFPELGLTVEQRLMLVYRMPFYMFVSHDKAALAANVELGFNRAIANGSFDQYFFNDPTVKEALARAAIAGRTVIELDNPSLPANTPLDRQELWLDPRKF